MLSDKTSNAITGISKATQKPGVRVKHLFRIMTHYPDLWMTAYAKIASNKGALTEGPDGNTLDGMSPDRLVNLMKLVKDGNYEPQPAKRTYIPKANGKKRPLGIPRGDDKLVQEVVRMLLEQVYEPVFSNYSHGFRPRRSCHTALKQIVDVWTGVKWVVDMDIKSFYDNIDHEVLLSTLEKKIDDKKFLNLIGQLLKAGHLEDWKFHATYSGTPQGGICSPILANIFLHELDMFMEKKMAEFESGKKRAINGDYKKLSYKITRRREKLRSFDEQPAFEFLRDEIDSEIKDLSRERMEHPSHNRYDPNFRRMRYIRYADDFLVGAIGSKEDAQKLKAEITAYLGGGLKLEVAEEKSGVRHTHDGFSFLGYHISSRNFVRETRSDSGRKNHLGHAIYRTSRTGVGMMHLSVPKEKVWDFVKRKGYMQKGRVASRNHLLSQSDFEIVTQFNSEMRGFANYYSLASKKNLYLVEATGIYSLLKTLANKHKTTSRKILRRMKRGAEYYYTIRSGGKVKQVKIFRLKHVAGPKWTSDVEPSHIIHWVNTELLSRIEANECEYCGKKGGYFEVHHLRKLADLKEKKNKETWEKIAIAKRRRTMVLCYECHRQLHAGKLPGWKKGIYAKAESAVQ